MSVYFGKCFDAIRQSWSQTHFTDIHVKSCDPFSGLMVLSGTYCTQADGHRSTRMLLMLKKCSSSENIPLGATRWQNKAAEPPRLSYNLFDLLPVLFTQTLHSWGFLHWTQKINCKNINLILVVILFLLEPIAKTWVIESHYPGVSS